MNLKMLFWRCLIIQGLANLRNSDNDKGELSPQRRCGILGFRRKGGGKS